jgi:uncharacterized protein DUF2213
MDTSKRRVTLVARVGGVAPLRRELLDGREHLVVSAVALTQGVLRAHGAPAPELVLAKDFGARPADWNDLPVTVSHPTGPASASLHGIGTIKNAKLSGDKLVVEAWLDPQRARERGRDAERVLERVRNGEMVDVSVGAYVAVVPEVGEYQGTPYSGRWTDIQPNHLACLREDEVPACTFAAGCGLPRAAEARANGWDVNIYAYALDQLQHARAEVPPPAPDQHQALLTARAACGGAEKRPRLVERQGTYDLPARPGAYARDAIPASPLRAAAFFERDHARKNDGTFVPTTSPHQPGDQVRALPSHPDSTLHGLVGTVFNSTTRDNAPHHYVRFPSVPMQVIAAPDLAATTDAADPSVIPPTRDQHAAILSNRPAAGAR